MEKRYVLRKGDFYLSDIMVNEDNQLINFTIDNDYRKLYNDYELAYEDKKLIFIETGLNLEIELFKKEE